MTALSSLFTTIRAALPTTTKGDLTVHNGTVNVRKAVGADNSVLMADSGETDGLRWAPYAEYAPPPPLSGRYIDVRRVITTVGSGTNVTMTADTLYGVPVWFRKGESLDGLIYQLVTAAAAGKLIRMGLYEYNPATGFGGDLVWDAGTVRADGAAGILLCTSGAPFVIPVTGWYCFVIVSDGAPTVRGINNTASAYTCQFLGILNTTTDIATPSTATTPYWSRAFTFGALPDPLGGTPAFITTNPPMMMAKVS